ncbi:GrlR family regulatory protein [Serratia marcescens]
MQNGLYAVGFSGVSDFGGGVVSVADNSVNGGDAICFYQGRIEQGLGQMKLRLAVKKYNPNGATIFGNINEFTLDLTGDDKGNGNYEFKGAISGQPQAVIVIHAKRVSHLI